MPPGRINQLDPEGNPWQGKLLGVYRDSHPHWVVDHGVYSVTLRCKGSLPKNTQTRLREIGLALQSIQPASAQAEALQRRHFAILERGLDQTVGFCPFARSEAADAMMDYLENYVHDGLSLNNWVIMPNHVHMVTAPVRCQKVDAFIEKWRRFKSRSARLLNSVLGRTGAFWQTSWHDRWIRDEAERERWLRYFANNPVKAGLSTKPEDYPYLR